MRQLSILIVFGFIILTSCDANKPTARAVRNDHSTSTTVMKPTRIDMHDRQDIQAQEVTPRMHERKTYNEKQISDDANDYPVDASDRGETYNEKQKSESPE